MRKKVLYLGDGPVRGSACYLLGILKYAGYEALHFSAEVKIPRAVFAKSFAAIVLSDYPRKKLSAEMLRWIEKSVREGSALLMIGGWGSFTGRDGNYRGSMVEKILPVTCLPKDDRHNLASGATFRVREFHPILKGLSFKPSPVIIGYNEVHPKKDSKVILELEENISKKRNPLLVLGHYGFGKTAAWTTDVAPHWCGGLVDWGSKRVQIAVTSEVQIEVGNDYVRFLSQLLDWLVILGTVPQGTGPYGVKLL